MKCQIRYEKTRLCSVQSWSLGCNQNACGGPAPVITMMGHHVLEAFFGYLTTKWKQPTSSSAPGQTKHDFSLSKNGTWRRARTAERSARVASFSDDLRPPRCQRETSCEWEMSRLTPEDKRNRDTVNNNDSQTGAVRCQLHAQRVNTANTNEFDSLLLESGRQFGFLNGQFLTGEITSAERERG